MQDRYEIQVFYSDTSGRKANVLHCDVMPQLAADILDDVSDLIRAKHYSTGEDPQPED